jgi:hypothetical protein
VEWEQQQLAQAEGAPGEAVAVNVELAWVILRFILFSAVEEAEVGEVLQAILETPGMQVLQQIQPLSTQLQLSAGQATLLPLPLAVKLSCHGARNK